MTQFQHALRLHREGRLDEAAGAYESLLSADPAHLDALIHLGVLRLGQRRIHEAETLLRRAVARAPDSPEAHANLAAVLQGSGRREQALTHYERALALNPGMIDARFGLAACLQALGRQEAAIACYRDILADDPAHPEANYGLATLLAELGHVDEAMAKYRAALTADPDFAEARYALGGLLARRGGLDEAVGHFRGALDIDPDYLDARLALGTALLRLERDDEAIAAFRSVIAAAPDRAEAHRGLGMLLGRNQRHAEAIEHFRIAVERKPDFVEAIAGLASALMLAGRHPEAIAMGRRAIALRPDHAPASSALGLALAEMGEMEEALSLSRHAVALAPDQPEFGFNLAELAKVRPGDAVLDALLSMLPRAGSLPSRDRCWLHFALAKALDDIGERERGFAHLLEGNAIKRSMIAYDEARALRSLDRIRAVFSADLLATRQGAGDPSGIPVFIVGMPRSGSTLVEQMLASHPAVFGAGERVELARIAERLGAGRVGGAPFPEAVWTATPAELCRSGTEYVAAVPSLAPVASRVTDKMPSNFRFVGLIRLILPNARILHVRRDPVDTCLSCFSKLFAGEQSFSYDLAELGRFHRAYARLMAHWREVLPPDAMLDISYEALVRDFPAEARRIVAHCGLPWDDACLRFHETPRAVHTASLTQVRQPIYRSSVGRWHPDEAAIRPLLEALQAP